jgi:hypothetical protein
MKKEKLTKPNPTSRREAMRLMALGILGISTVKAEPKPIAEDKPKVAEKKEQPYEHVDNYPFFE